MSMAETPKDPSGYDELQEAIARGDAPASGLDRRDRATRREVRARGRQQQALGASGQKTPIDAYLEAAYPGIYLKSMDPGLMRAELNLVRTLAKRSADMIREVEKIAEQDVDAPDEMSDEPSIAWAQGYASALVALLAPLRAECDSHGPDEADEADNG